MSEFDAPFADGYASSTAEETVIISTADDVGERADVFIAKRAGITRSQAQKLIASENACLIKLGGASALLDKKYKLAEGDRVVLTLPEAVEYECVAEDIPLDIVYEDDDVIVVNKPRGMVVHPAPGHQSGTLVSALLWHCGASLSGINGVLRPGIVHRIDMDTTGLLLACKNDKAHISIAAQLETHDMFREYVAVVSGNMKEDHGTVDAPIGRNPVDRKKMAVITKLGANARRAVTHWSVERAFDGYTLCKMRLETGRTHQIRVHMSYIGHRILGDPLYGSPSVFEKKHPSMFAGQMLHAARLSFTHPTSGERLTLEAPPPRDFEAVVELLEKTNNK